MKYLLLMYADPSIGSNYSQEELQAQADAWYAYMEDAKAAGVLLSNGGLDPAATANRSKEPSVKNTVVSWQR